MEQLTSSGAETIVFDVIFSEVSSPPSEADLSFAEALKSHGQVIMPLYIEATYQQGPLIEIPPAQLFYRELARAGHIHVAPDEDGVVRGVFLREGVGDAFWPHLSYQALDVIEKAPEMTGERAPVQASNPMLIERDYYNLIPMPKAEQGFLRLSFFDVLEGVVDSEVIRGKTVYIGASAAGLGDYITTPVGGMSGVEFNGWVYQAINHGDLIRAANPLIAACISSALVLILLSTLIRLSPAAVLISLLTIFLSWLLIVAVLLLRANYWLPPFSLLLSLVLFYPLWSWLRLEVALRFLNSEIVKFRESHWDYSQMNLNNAQVAANYLERMGVVKAWQLSSDKPNFLKNANGAPSLLSSENWDDEVSGGTLKVIDGVSGAFKLSAIVEQDRINQFENYLPALQGLTIERRKKLRGAELISQTIEQLVAARRQAEVSQRLIEQSLSGLQDAVVISDLCGRVLFSNKAFKLLSSGLANDTGILESLEQIALTGDLLWEQLIRDVIESEKLYTHEATTKNGDQDLLCQVTRMSLADYGVDTIIYVFTDVSTLKASEKSRMEALNFLSHDLRSPMVSVLAILEQHASGRMDTDKAFVLIKQHVTKNLEYAESFLQLSRAEALIETSMFPTDMHAVIDAVQVHGQALAAAKGSRLKVIRTLDECWVMAQADLLERAVINLISNGIKYSPEGAEVSVELAVEGSSIKVSVTDNGRGIDSEQQQLLFSKFHRDPSSGSEHGAGLGLYFVSVVVARHGGSLDVESEIGEGSRFTIELPLVDLSALDF